MKSRTEILVPLAAIQAVPIAVIAWYRLHRYAWYRYSAIVTIISNNTFKVTICDLKNKRNMANNIDKKEPVAICDQSKIDVTKCDNHELAGNIEPLIKVIRGQQVMLDKDLAMLYGVEAKVLNQAVKRNVERFPNDFRFQLTKEECLRSQCALNEKQGQHLKYMPYAFTEQGVAMLSSVLRSQTAIEVNIRKQQRTYL